MDRHRDLVCPACGRPLVGDGAFMLACNGCAQAYPVIHEVPVVLPGVIFEESPDSPPEWAVERFVRLLDIPPSESIHQRAARILQGRLIFPDRAMTIESAQFVERVRNSLGERWPKELDILLEKSEVDAHEDTVNHPDGIRYRWTQCHLPSTLTAGSLIWANCRIGNCGTTTLSSTSKPAVFVAGRWIPSPAGSPGGRETLSRRVRGMIESLALRQPPRTELLIDMPPGREVTLPVQLRVPRRAGRYTLELALVGKDGRWYAEDSHDTSIDVAARGHPPAAPPCEIEPGEAVGYDEDHKLAIERLKGWVAESFADHPVTLELGGNFSSFVWTLGLSRFMNVDIDAIGLQFAALKTDSRAIGVCADGLSLPFRDGYFDLVVMFSTLHHFADPIGLLRHIRAKLKPTGRLAILCEPVGHVTRVSMPGDYRSELLKGVNEQSFNLPEYAMFFEQSGFGVQGGSVRSGSLKVWLAPVF